MKITPLFDRVVIKEIEQDKSKSNIILPPTSQEKPLIGKVVAVGSGLDVDNNKVGMQVKVGDKVVFNKYLGADIKIEEESFIILRQIDLIAILND